MFITCVQQCHFHFKFHIFIVFRCGHCQLKINSLQSKLLTFRQSEKAGKSWKKLWKRTNSVCTVSKHTYCCCALKALLHDHIVLQRLQCFQRFNWLLNRQLCGKLAAKEVEVGISQFHIEIETLQMAKLQQHMWAVWKNQATQAWHTAVHIALS